MLCVINPIMVAADFDKYEAVRPAEELVSVANTAGHAKAASYDVIATTPVRKSMWSKSNQGLLPGSSC